MTEKPVKMRCIIGSLAGRTVPPVWSLNEIFETSEELAIIFEAAKHAIRIKEPSKEELKESKKGSK